MTASKSPIYPPVEILIAEDSATQAKRLCHILEEQGYRVTIATNGRLALEAARAKKPTLIISDVVMPEMDGYELCHRVKNDPILEGLPVILVTTLSDPQDVIRGLECRADNFILKPYDEHHLLSRVQFVLINREFRQAEQSGMGVEIFFNGQKHFITADRLQILNLLLSTYDAAIQRNKELSAAQNDLSRLNSSLEMANRELEAFSYTVSHDLRGPLRAIEGFSTMALEKFSAHIPAEGKRFLDNVVRSAKRMSQLIDDLLRLSRLSRQQINKKLVSIDGLVREVFADLSDSHSGRNLEIKIGELPDCQGDQSLLKQVFVNLLSNAIKFTGRTEKGIVEVNSKRAGNEIIYYVRDNGAGFEMQYAEKLFGAFQRLHTSSEFEGTGIGLSIVQRIINRHGGRIWAESEVEKGATFFFTLAQKA